MAGWLRCCGASEGMLPPVHRDEEQAPSLTPAPCGRGDRNDTVGDLPPLPRGEGTGIRRLVIYPLSLWERAGVRVPFVSRPGPHPHPLPVGEGTGMTRLGIYPLSLWERAGVRVPFVSRPGRHPHPLPRGEGTGIRRLVIYPLSLWERAGVRVPFASRPGRHPNPLPRGEGTGIRRLVIYPLSHRERGPESDGRGLCAGLRKGGRVGTGLRTERVFV